MKKHIIVLFVLFFAFAKAQTTNPSLLLSIQRASQMEIDNYAPGSLEDGMLVYNTDEKRVYEYTSGSFVELITTGNVYVGHFVISATGAQSITGIPFKPNKIDFRAVPNIETTTINDSNDSGDLNTRTLANTFGSMSGYAFRVGTIISQQVIFTGGSGSSINDISRYANTAQCIGVRYANVNGDNLGLTTASVTSFDTSGFTLNVANATDNLLILYTAYR